MPITVRGSAAAADQLGQAQRGGAFQGRQGEVVGGFGVHREQHRTGQEYRNLLDMGRSGWFARILSGVQHAPYAFDAGFQRLEVGL
jgi:hypothetical protein